MQHAAHFLKTAGTDENAPRRQGHAPAPRRVCLVRKNANGRVRGTAKKYSKKFKKRLDKEEWI